jgi:hypothetical protein
MGYPVVFVVAAVALSSWKRGAHSVCGMSSASIKCTAAARVAACALITPDATARSSFIIAKIPRRRCFSSSTVARFDPKQPQSVQDDGYRAAFVTDHTD